MVSFVFITGATSGFGKACADIFAQNGFDLILVARRTDRLQNISEELTSKYGIEVLTETLDVRNENEVRECCKNLSDDIKNRLLILINNAGLAAGRDTIEKGLTSDWNQMIDTNIKGLLYVSQAIIPILKKNGKGHIFNLSSIAGKEVYLNGNVYCATKHAVDSLSKAMRMELVEFGIKVTNIAPGAADTEFSLVRFKGDQQRAKAVYEGFTPLTPDDIADAIYYASTLPRHVCINDLTLTCITQANAHYNIKK